jgi:hypothetical protein
MAGMSESGESSSTTSRIDLGTVSFSAAPGWKFYPMTDRIVGRPMTGVGGIQIVRVDPHSIPWPATHEVCMAAAQAAMGLNIEGPGFDRAKEYGECCIAGGESFRTAKNYVRVWYRHCPDGMIAAWFRCRQARAAERSVIESLRAADRMIATIRVPPPLA